MNDTPDDGEHPSGDDPGLIDDPYLIGPLRAAVPPPPRSPIASAPRALRARRGTVVNVALGLALVLSWGTGIGLLIQRVTAAPAEPSAAVAGPPRRASARASSRPAPSAASPDLRVPKATTTIARDAVTVIDVGVDARSLADELTKQRAAAQEAHQTMIVMTTLASCGPCTSVFEALPDPRMQAALTRVRLVRVYADVFRDDLDQLEIPSVNFPGFFVLGPDLRPRDGIDGGEWDDDVPENMAPVLEAFVRGTLTKRRTPWQALPGSGMRL
ncbi:MAG: hypothetical protein ABJE95_11245 [Byssovorax sp.]